MAEAVQANKVGRIEFYAYIIFVVGSIFSLPFILQPSTFVSTNIYIAYTIITIVGVIVPFAISWNINKRGDRQAFLYRYISLDVPCGVLATLLMIFLFTLFNIVFQQGYGTLMTSSDLVIDVIGVVFFTFLITKYMKSVAGLKTK